MKLTITFLAFCVALLSDSGEFPWGSASSCGGPAVGPCSFLAAAFLALLAELSTGEPRGSSAHPFEASLHFSCGL